VVTWWCCCILCSHIMWQCCCSLGCGLIGAVAALCVATVMWHCCCSLGCGSLSAVTISGAAYTISSRVIWQDVRLFESSYWSAFIWKVTQVAFGTWDSIVLHNLDWCIVSGCVFLYLDCWMKLIQCLDVLKIDYVWLQSFIDWLHLSWRLHFSKACQMQAVAGLQKTAT
jgi:hypothetical protein